MYVDLSLPCNDQASSSAVHSACAAYREEVGDGAQQHELGGGGRAGVPCHGVVIVRVYVCVYMRVCAHVCTCASVCVCMSVCACLCVCVCECECECVCVWTELD